MTSPQRHLNTAAIRAERRASLAIAGHVLCLIILTAGLMALAHAGLTTALAVPDIAAEALRQARW